MTPQIKLDWQTVSGLSQRTYPTLQVGTAGITLRWKYRGRLRPCGLRPNAYLVGTWNLDSDGEGLFLSDYTEAR